MDIQLSISIVLTCIIVGLSVYILFLRKLLKRVGMELLQALSDKQTVVNYLEEEMAKNNTLQLSDDDGFIKFLSQSRDWAFKYIEDVQDHLNDFVAVVGPVLDYYDKYGRIHESESMNKILDAYQKLLEVLPETENKQQGENNE